MSRTPTPPRHPAAQPMAAAARRTSAPGAPRITPTDGELLGLFLTQGDRAALDRVIERHSPMVWGVCRQQLRREQDAEDAFQATFLVLIKHAASIRSSDSAAGWLYRVAYRTSIRARKRLALRREEALALDPDAPGEEAFPDLLKKQTNGVLVEELMRLPAKYQTPLVLRYLEGQSRRLIADQTDSTIASVQGRLARGKAMLRRRLLRRGVSLSAAMAALGLGGREAQAAVPSHVVAQTATNGAALATGGSLAASAAVTLLYRQGANALLLAWLGKPAAVATAAAVVAAFFFAPGGGGPLPVAHGAEPPINAALPDEESQEEDGAPIIVAQVDRVENQQPQPPEEPDAAYREVYYVADLLKLNAELPPDERVEGSLESLAAELRVAVPSIGELRSFPSNLSLVVTGDRAGHGKLAEHLAQRRQTKLADGADPPSRFVPNAVFIPGEPQPPANDGERLARLVALRDRLKEVDERVAKLGLPNESGAGAEYRRLWEETQGAIERLAEKQFADDLVAVKQELTVLMPGGGNAEPSESPAAETAAAADPGENAPPADPAGAELNELEQAVKKANLANARAEKLTKRAQDLFEQNRAGVLNAFYQQDTPTPSWAELQAHADVKPLERALWRQAQRLRNETNDRVAEIKQRSEQLLTGIEADEESLELLDRLSNVALGVQGLERSSWRDDRDAQAFFSVEWNHLCSEKAASKVSEAVGRPSGFFSHQQSREDLRQFQRENGLGPTGEFNEATWNRLFGVGEQEQKINAPTVTAAQGEAAEVTMPAPGGDVRATARTTPEGETELKVESQPNKPDDELAELRRAIALREARVEQLRAMLEKIANPESPALRRTLLDTAATLGLDRLSTDETNTYRALQQELARSLNRSRAEQQRVAELAERWHAADRDFQQAVTKLNQIRMPNLLDRDRRRSPADPANPDDALRTRLDRLRERIEQAEAEGAKTAKLVDRIRDTTDQDLRQAMLGAWQVVTQKHRNTFGGIHPEVTQLLADTAGEDDEVFREVTDLAKRWRQAYEKLNNLTPSEKPEPPKPAEKKNTPRPKPPKPSEKEEQAAFGLPAESVYLGMLRATETYKRAPGDLPSQLELRLSERLKRHRSRAERDRRPVKFVVGQLEVAKGDDPQLVTAQMKVLSDGYFLDVYTEPQEPIGFRMTGYLPEDIRIGEPARVVHDTGVVTLRKTPPAEQRTVRGKLFFPDGVVPRGARVRFKVDHGPINNYSNGYEPRSRYPEGVEASINASGEWEVTGLSPVEYNVYFSAPDYLRQHRSVRLDQVTSPHDLGEVMLEEPRRLTIRYVSKKYDKDSKGAALEELLTRAKSNSRATVLEAGDRFRTGDERHGYAYAFEVLQKLGRLSPRISYQPAGMVDLGATTFAELEELPPAPGDNHSLEAPELLDGHVYLFSSDSYNYAALLRIEIEGGDAPTPTPTRAVDPEGTVEQGVWRHFTEPSKLNPNGWATVVELKPGEGAPVLLPGEDEPTRRVVMREVTDARAVFDAISAAGPDLARTCRVRRNTRPYFPFGVEDDPEQALTDMHYLGPGRRLGSAIVVLRKHHNPKTGYWKDLPKIPSRETALELLKQASDKQSSGPAAAAEATPSATGADLPLFAEIADASPTPDTANQYGPDSEMEQGEWNCFPEPTALNPKGWATIAEMEIGDHAPVLLPDDKRPRPHLRLESRNQLGTGEYSLEFVFEDPPSKNHGQSVEAPRGRGGLFRVRGQTVEIVGLSDRADEGSVLVLIRSHHADNPVPAVETARRFLQARSPGDVATRVMKDESRRQTAAQAGTPPDEQPVASDAPESGSPAREALLGHYRPLAESVREALGDIENLKAWASVSKEEPFDVQLSLGISLQLVEQDFIARNPGVKPLPEHRAAAEKNVREEILRRVTPLVERFPKHGEERRITKVVFFAENGPVPFNPGVTMHSEPVAKRPPGRVDYTDGRADGKKSLGGSGHLIRFELPEGAAGVKSLRLHGSRYGTTQAPREDFEVSFLSEDRSEILAVRRGAYGLFRRGEEKWTTVRFDKPVVDLPETFWVAIDFNPGRTKGIYLSYDTSTGGERSMTGLAQDEPARHKRVDFGGDWMVSLILERGGGGAPRSGSHRAEEAALADPAASSARAPTPPDKEAATPIQRAMRVRVVDASGAPIPGVRVYRNHVYKQIETSQEHDIENATYHTDAKGEVTVELSGFTHDLRLWATKKGHVPLHAMWAVDLQTDGDRVPTDFVFRLAAGTKIGGVVRDSKGEPIAGATIAVEDRAASRLHLVHATKRPGRRPIRSQWLASGVNVTTDADGRWELDTVPTDDELMIEHVGNARSLRLRVKHPDYEPFDEITQKVFTEQSGFDLGAALNATAKRGPSSLLSELRAGTAVTVLDRKQSSETTGPPKIVEMTPEANATGVDPALSEIRFTFNRDMMTKGGATVRIEAHRGTVSTILDPRAQPRWIDRRTCVVPVWLRPSARHDVQLLEFRYATGEKMTPLTLGFGVARLSEAYFQKQLGRIEQEVNKYESLARDFQELATNEDGGDLVQAVWKKRAKIQGVETLKRLQDFRKQLEAYVNARLSDGDTADLADAKKVQEEVAEYQRGLRELEDRFQSGPE